MNPKEKAIKYLKISDKDIIIEEAIDIAIKAERERIISLLDDIARVEKYHIIYVDKEELKRNLRKTGEQSK